MLTTLFDDHLRIQRQRADEALAACGFESLAIYAGALRMQFLDDQPYPFKANPHFKLWTPLADAVDCWIVYRPGAAPAARLPAAARLLAQAAGDAERLLDERISTIEVIREADDARAHVAGLPRCAFIGEWREEFRDWGFARSIRMRCSIACTTARAIKTDYELECMRRASARAANGHHAAEARLQRAGASEYEIHLAYLRATGHTDNELPYPSIVALNRNAAVLHYQHQERRALAAADRVRS